MIDGATIFYFSLTGVLPSHIVSQVFHMLDLRGDLYTLRISSVIAGYVCMWMDVLPPFLNIRCFIIFSIRI